jgi:hypothetical protein
MARNCPVPSGDAEGVIRHEETFRPDAETSKGHPIGKMLMQTR